MDAFSPQETTASERDVLELDWTGRSWRTDDWTGRSWRTDDWTGRSWRSFGAF